VFTALDTELHRVVALKRIQDRHADDARSQYRFLLEAEVTARLEHPGVVPVHGLFPDEAGRPCYAMRFIEGQTLDDALHAYHAAPPDPVAFRRLLQSFIQVCQTVAYAHSRGIIHRDLKPQNIMLGKFGETLVVDWGLAKVVGRSGEEQSAGAETTLRPSGDSSGEQTQMGDAVGTPAFMSPEQAAGRWDVIDPRSDVYALGAVLYTLLTGRPPLQARNWPEMQQKIQRGEFPRPRSVKPVAPRALEAVCLKAMALKPGDRYPSARALAAEVELWLADEPVQEYREPTLDQLRRWARRHKPLMSGLLTLLITAVIALSISTLVVSQQKAETEGALHKAEQAAQREAMNAAQVNKLQRVFVDRLGDFADSLSGSEGLPGDQHYQLARMYALAAVGAAAERAEEYRKRAVLHLRRAADTGFFKAPGNVTKLSKPDFDSLRARTDFKRFAKELEQ
jgi:serine/threonine protein kinase